jgi:hypothetical protein
MKRHFNQMFCLFALLILCANALESERAIFGTWYLNVNTGSSAQTSFENRDELVIQTINGNIMALWKLNDGGFDVIEKLKFDEKTSRLSFCRNDVNNHVNCLLRIFFLFFFF